MAVTTHPQLAPPGQHVRVVFPHVGGLPGTIDGADGAAVIVALAVPDDRVPKLAGREVGVEWVTGRGIQRLFGTLVVESSECVRVVVAGEAERIQRRSWARIDAVAPITVRGIDEPVGGATTTLNVSGGGVLVKDLWNLPLGTDVRIELEAEPGKPPIRALGRVVREAAKDEKGIRIDSIGREDEERLIRYVRDRERAALRMARGR
jgi:c-di-GMP-binding flagellar brake protein YcgR